MHLQQFVIYNIIVFSIKFYSSLIFVVIFVYIDDDNHENWNKEIIIYYKSVPKNSFDSDASKMKN